MIAKSSTWKNLQKSGSLKLIFIESIGECIPQSTFSSSFDRSVNMAMASCACFFVLVWYFYRKALLKALIRAVV